MTSHDRDDHRLVYTTEKGRISDTSGRRAAPAPAGDGTVRVSRTKAGRKGKTVTLVTGVPPADLAALAKELKRVLGTGGAVKDGAVEIQGDHRDRIVTLLGGRYRVKAAGG